MPERAKQRPIPAKGYLIDALGRGGYAVTDGTYNFMFFVGTRGVVAVDAPAAMGPRILQAIREKTRKPVTHVVYSHEHFDHIGAANLYPKSAKIYAHEATAWMLRQTPDVNRPAPDVTFSGRGRYTLRAQGVVLHLDYHGNNHQEGQLFVWAPRQRVLLHIDIVFPRWAPFKQLAIAQYVPGYMKAIDKTLDYPFRYLVAGHLSKLATRADVVEQQEYVRELYDAAKKANGSVDYVAVTRGVDPENTWAQFETYSDAVTAACVELMPKDWLTRIGGADVWLDDNCFTMSEAQRIHNF